MRDLRDNLAEVLGPAYRIIRELSGAGMSRVFLAEEIALDRDVVVKVVSPELVDEEFLGRFEQEIRQTARLQHPGIVPVLTVGTVAYPSGARGPYYVMPYIRGETLRSRLEREGPFPVALCIRVLRDVGEALLQAHRHGVVHRDVKPENIFIAGGHAVVTDFGIARAVSRRDLRRTMPGLVLGTPAYMAPEQAVGDDEVDHRADLYALGVVAYEILTGTPPFKGNSARELLVAHATAEPVALGTLRPDLPAPLVDAVMRCLAKNPRHRWEGADEMLRALELVRATDTFPVTTPVRLTAEPTGRQRSRRILIVGLVLAAAVTLGVVLSWLRPALPTDVSGSTIAVIRAQVAPDPLPALAALGERLQRTITHELQRNRAPVLDHLAVDDYQAAADRADAARRRRIGTLVVTTLRRTQRGLEIDLSLVNAVSGVQLRSAELGLVDTTDYEGLSEGMVDSLRGWLRLPSLHAREVAARAPGIAVLFEEAEQATRTRTAEGLARAVALYRTVLERNPADAEAHARLSTVYSLLLVYAYRSAGGAEQVAASALAHAERSIQLDPASDEAYTARAYVLNQLNAPVSLVRADFDRARDLNPSTEPGWYAILLMRENRRDEALTEARRGVALDPRSPGRWLALAWEAMGFKDYGTALLAADSALQLDPNLSLARGVLARARLLGGHAADCAEMEAWPYLGTRAACLAAVGRRTEAAAMVDSLIHRFTTGDPQFDSALFAEELAAYFSFTGESDAARIWIRELYHRTPIGLAAPFQRSDLFAKTLADRGFSQEVARLAESANLRVRQGGQLLLAGLPGQR